MINFGILDIVTYINNSDYCNIELQVLSQDTIIERILYYWSKLYSRQIKAGDNYELLQKSIVILIADFNIDSLENLPYHTTWKIIEDKNRKTILTNKLELHIIEVPKILSNTSNDNNELLDWLLFLENPNCERVKEKMKSNKELKQAHDKLDTLSNDEYLQRIADLRQKAILDRNAQLSTSYRKGVDTGIEKGIALEKENSKRIIELEREKNKRLEIEKAESEKKLLNEKIETAKKLIKANVDIKIIQEATGLSIDEINKLKNEN